MSHYLIFNAHLDPVWLWPWQAGLDEILATCRSACDRLDAHPDLIFTRGEAWVYQQLERLDPPLFERVRKHIQSGQWEITGGWWIQPDCNLISGWGLEKQIELGKEYFTDRFGIFPRVGYNVDSFGHAATLPTIMRAMGQDRYVFMRPQPDEMTLPARIFRWREREGAPEVTTFRIGAGYLTYEPTVERVRAVMREVPPGIEHTMLFMGVGDHGGGPTEKQIAWCRDNEYCLPDCRLVFSSPSRFFDAIEGQADLLPVVTGEMQIHAIGCYSVHRPVKLGVRRAEHLLKQAEQMQKSAPQPDADNQIHEAWKRVCFHHFHDTLCGTSLPSAYQQVHDSLGFASAIADEILQYGVRHKLRELPDDELQRIVLHNASDAPFEGFVEFEPWLDWQTWKPGWRLLDENNQPLDFQLIDAEGLGQPQVRLLFKQEIQPDQMRVVKIEKRTAGATPSITPRVEMRAAEIKSDVGATCTSSSLEFADAPSLSLPYLDLIEDPSDTWSHWIDRYPAGPGVSAQWSTASLIDRGPLMASLIQTGALAESTLRAEWRVYGGEAFVELRLGVHWRAKQKLLKFVVPLPVGVERRTDGILGGHIERDNNACERPLRDWTLLHLGTGSTLGVVCPDVFGIDATPQALRLTLLRSSVMAHHVPYFGTGPRAVISDQGVHEFRFRFFCGASVNETLLDSHALMMQRPPLIADLTRGMPTRFDSVGDAA